MSGEERSSGAAGLSLSEEAGDCFGAWPGSASSGRGWVIADQQRAAAVALVTVGERAVAGDAGELTARSGGSARSSR
jgi:hypothetical protein